MSWRPRRLDRRLWRGDGAAAAAALLPESCALAAVSVGGAGGPPLLAPNLKPLRAGPAAADVRADLRAVLLAETGGGLSGTGVCRPAAAKARGQVAGEGQAVEHGLLRPRGFHHPQARANCGAAAGCHRPRLRRTSLNRYWPRGPHQRQLLQRARHRSRPLSWNDTGGRGGSRSNGSAHRRQHDAINKFPLPNEITSLPTKCTRCFFFTRPPPFFAQPSTFTRPPAARAIEIHGDWFRWKDIKVLFTIAVTLLRPRRTQPMAGNFLGRQSP